MSSDVWPLSIQTETQNNNIMAKVLMQDRREPELLKTLLILKNVLNGSYVDSYKNMEKSVNREISKLPAEERVQFKNSLQIMSTLKKCGFIYKDTVKGWNWTEDKDMFPNIHTARKLLEEMAKLHSTKGKKRQQNADEGIRHLRIPETIEQTRIRINIGNGDMILDLKAGAKHEMTIGGVPLTIEVFRIVVGK